MLEARHGNRQAGELLKFITLLQSSTIGRTIPEMMSEMECSRRTVIRLLEELKNWGLDDRTCVLDSDHHLTKRYRLRNALPAAMLGLSTVDRGALESLLKTLPSGSDRKALSKLLAAQSLAGVSSSIDQETLIERVAYLGRVGPKITVSPAITATLERAIQGFERLEMVYKTPHESKPIARTVEPLGLIYSRFGYLVARQSGVVKTFRFEQIKSTRLTGELFEAGRFNLKDWADESFGIFHGDELKTHVMEFSPKVADRAESVRFHSSEKKERLKDGSLRITLRCRGHKELMWELSHPDWQGHVTIT
jgi:predicted DNA-binding transcriptional regulator YafY